MHKSDRVVFLGLFICFFISACSPEKRSGLIIEKTNMLDSIPSGSGIVVRNDSAYIIGDDATALYQINIHDLRFRKISLPGFESNEYREPKDTKHDYESLTIVPFGNDYITAFGSGSKSFSRDSIMLINIANQKEIKIASLQNFYKKLQVLTQTDSVHWNIEGASVSGKNLFLCNRGNNLLIQFKIKDFLYHIFQPESPFPAVQHYQVKLPAIANREARLSGICTVDDTTVLFTASVEDTPDWTKDGPVLGSYLALYSLKSNKVLSTFLLQDDAGKPLIEKLESVDIVERKQNGELNLIAIGDNDNGSTKLFRLSLKAE